MLPGRISLQAVLRNANSKIQILRNLCATYQKIRREDRHTCLLGHALRVYGKTQKKPTTLTASLRNWGVVRDRAGGMLLQAPVELGTMGMWYLFKNNHKPS